MRVAFHVGPHCIVKVQTGQSPVALRTFRIGRGRGGGGGMRKEDWATVLTEMKEADILDIPNYTMIY